MIGQYQDPQMGWGNPYAQQPYGQNPYPQGTGWQYNGQPTATVKQENNLTQEEIQQLLKKGNQFSIALTETEKLRGICNHRSADGMKDALREIPGTGEYVCDICGYKFTPAIITTANPDDVNDNGMAELTAAIHTVQNYLQTTKLIYPDMPKEAQRSFYAIIPLLDKIPGLYKIATSVFMNKEGGRFYTYANQGMPVVNAFRQLMSSIGPMGNPYLQQVQQPYGYGYGQPAWGQPIYGQAPQGQFYSNPQMGGYNPQSNGFGYNGAAMAQDPNMANPQQPQGQAAPSPFAPQSAGYNPQTVGYAYQPNQQAGPNVANTVPTQSGQSATQPMQPQQSAPGTIVPESQQTTTDGNTTSVTAKFNA